MKKLLFCLFIIFASVATKAQTCGAPLNHLLVDHNGSAACGDLTIVLYAYGGPGYTTLVGTSNPMSLQAAGTVSYSDTPDYTPTVVISWATKPSAGTCYRIRKVDIYNCATVGTSGTPDPSCSSTIVNGCTVGDIGGLSLNQCFHYSTTCTSCPSGTTATVNFSGGAMSVDTH